MSITIRKIQDEVGCAICGYEFIEFPNAIELQCNLCGAKTTTNSYCVQHHFICDNCLDLDVYGFIISVCLRSNSIDPLGLAVQIMNSPLVKMHGPEHHFIVPAVLLTCTHNFSKSNENLRDLLEKAKINATKSAPDCSFHKGYCGASIGAGIFLNMLTNQDPDSENEWSEANKLIALCVNRIDSSPGPRCCKRDTYLTLEETIKYLKLKYAILLPITEAKCTFSLRNKSCGREDCNFYNIGWSLV